MVSGSAREHLDTNLFAEGLHLSLLAARFHYFALTESKINLAALAITPSRMESSAGESETKIAIARCFPLGKVTMPISFVAAVIPFSVPDVPVL